METIKYDLPKSSLKEKIYNLIINSSNGGVYDIQKKIMVDEINVSHLTDKMLELFQNSLCKHKVVFETSVLKYEKWLQEKRDNGEVQTQCENCGLWLFEDEF